MRLALVLLVFLPALIYGRPMAMGEWLMESDIHMDSSESGEGKPMDGDEPSNSVEDMEKTTDLSDSSEPVRPTEGKEKEIKFESNQIEPNNSFSQGYIGPEY